MNRSFCNRNTYSSDKTQTPFRDCTAECPVAGTTIPTIGVRRTKKEIATIRRSTVGRPAFYRPINRPNFSVNHLHNVPNSTKQKRKGRMTKRVITTLSRNGATRYTSRRRTAFYFANSHNQGAIKRPIIATTYRRPTLPVFNNYRSRGPRRINKGGGRSKTTATIPIHGLWSTSA